MVADPYKCYTEAQKKKVKTAATFRHDPGIIRKIQQRIYGSLALRKDRDGGERNTICETAIKQPGR